MRFEPTQTVAACVDVVPAPPAPAAVPPGEPMDSDDRVPCFVLMDAPTQLMQDDRPAVPAQPADVAVDDDEDDDGEDGFVVVPTVMTPGAGGAPGDENAAPNATPTPVRPASCGAGSESPAPASQTQGAPPLSFFS